MSFQLSDDYITVAERIVEFRERFPNGSLQPWNRDQPFTIETINGNPCFVVVAAAYRTYDDERPGIGMAYEPVPGSTPYTRGSELQNAETAAWGRAIIAALAADAKRGIASREEVEQQRAREAQPQPPRAQSRRNTEQAAADWNAALEAAQGDFEALGKLHHEAIRQNAPAEFLNRVKAAGNAAMPKDTK